MAEDTREIVYHKGHPYYVIRRGEVLIELEDTSSSIIKKLVGIETVLTPEEFEQKKENRRSEHINWTK